ncbi:MAG: hypothetical protein O3A00_10910, partial [Planctomycetota bacterium]|nr:hypothetical protein [Planctomycetota bacterium]
MPKPLIAILSQQPRYASDLPELLRDRFDFLACDSVDEARELLASHKPVGLVADFERTRGGHLEDQLLDELQSRMPKMAIVMVTQEECAEPLERRAATTKITWLKDVSELTQISEAIEHSLNGDAPVPARPQPTTGSAGFIRSGKKPAP